MPSKKSRGKSPRGAPGAKGRRARRPRYAKLAITVPAEQAGAIRAAVDDGAAPSVSAFVAAAVREKLEHDSLGALVAEMKREFGEPEAELCAEVEAWLERQRRGRAEP
jgi:Arc/MetJ-type ribon-helix-helix transcriptional regulator